MVYLPRRLFGRARRSDDPEVPNKRRDYSKSIQVVIIGLVIAAVGAAAAAWPSIRHILEDSQQANTQQPGLQAQPAPAKNPPVLLTAVTGLDSSVGGGDLALPTDTPLNATDLEALKERASNRDHYSEWAIQRNAAAISPAHSSITVMGNWDQEVNIRSMEVVKVCAPPVPGTYLRVASEGSGEAARIGLDLDSPEPAPREVVFGAGGPLITQDDYFSRHTLTLQKGETTTLSVWVFSSHLKCSFQLSILVASASGVYRVEVPQPSHFPNSVTPGISSVGVRGFKRAYKEEFVEGSGSYDWLQLDPSELAR
jgi:hypothetical protein